jgi:hypothetical protein
MSFPWPAFRPALLDKSLRTWRYAPYSPRNAYRDRLSMSDLEICTSEKVDKWDRFKWITTLPQNIPDIPFQNAMLTKTYGVQIDYKSNGKLSVCRPRI